MARLIDADAVKELVREKHVLTVFDIDEILAVDAAPVQRGKWDLLVAKQGECEWAADACCSLCGFTKRQIWRGYFPVETTEFARGTTMYYANKVKLPNYCEQCGADLKGDKNEVD